jgi:hypothetical protein
MKGLLVLLFVVAAAVWGWFHFLAPKHYAPGILIPDDPEQSTLPDPQELFRHGKASLQPLAGYSIEARVLHTRHYRTGDVAAIAPYDVAVGWGVMSDQSVLDRLEITQANRFYFWEYQDNPPIPKNEIIAHSANMHLIPASDALRRKIAWLRPGDLIRMKGLLVEVTLPGRNPWRSSLSRTDNGNGACEIMWVESLEKR